MEVYAVLVAEPDNPYDANAVSVWVKGLKVGYLSREDARATGPACLPWSRSMASRSRLPAPLWAAGYKRTARVGSVSSWTTTQPTSAFARWHRPDRRDQRCGPDSLMR